MTAGPAAADDWGPSPDQNSDSWTRAAEQGGAAPLTGVTCTVPGGQPVALDLDMGSSQTVIRDLNLGSRWTADLTVIRSADRGTYELVTTPGAIFNIAHGWDYGGGETDLRPYGRYRLAARPSRTRLAPIQLSLVDDWIALSWARFLEERTIDAGTDRTLAIRALVLEALPGTEVVIRGGAGQLTGDDITESRDRAQLIMTLTRDGNLIVFFDSEGRFIVDNAPKLAASPGVSFVDGVRSTIVDLTTEQTLTSPYNALIVEESDTSAYETVRIQIANTNHPLHRNNLGVVVPAFCTAPTAQSQAQAQAFAATMLTRLAGGDEKVTVSSWGLDLDPGSTFSTYESSTWTDLDRHGLWLAERVERDLLTVAVRVAGRSNTTVLTEEIS